MNVKNFNPFERHVEKITLAVAAAGAAYMIWLAYPPTLTVEANGQPVAADEVEPVVTKAVADLKAAREKTRNIGPIAVKVPDLAHEYMKKMREQPLPDYLIAQAGFPQIAPPQVPVDNIGNIPGPDHMLPIATPKVPAPTDLSAVAYRGVVVVTPPLPPNVPQPAPGTVTGEVKDVDVVLVKGVVDIGLLTQQMADPSIPENQRLPAAFQRSVIYRIEAQKRKRDSSGWGEWQPAKTDAVPPLEIDWAKLRDEDLQPTVNNLETQLKQIAQPEYYPTPTGASVVQQILSGITSPVITGAAAAPAAPGWAGGPANPDAMGGPAGRGGPGTGRPGAGQRPGAVPEFAPWDRPGGIPAPPPPPAPGPAAGAPGAPALAALPALPTPGGVGQPTTVPFWVLDDNVQPGQEYQYRVRIVMYNPTYRWPHALQDPAMKNNPVIMSDWTPVPAPVTVQSSMYFFITEGRVAAPNNPPRVTAQVFRWKAGQWFMTDVIAQPGMPIVATNMKVGPPPPEDVDVNHVVVDVVPAGNDVSVVLMNNKGELVTHDAREDRLNPKRQDLIKQVLAARPVATRPAPPPPRAIPPRPSPFQPDRDREGDRNPDFRR